ncbi:hypothetical protein MASR2M69_06580 [Bacteroidota bacterium]
MAKDKTHQYRLESSMFNGRFKMNIDFYNKLTEELLTDVNLPTAGGFQATKQISGGKKQRYRA